MTALNLSPRQVQVCTRASTGESDKEIAKAIGCSVRTVRFHMDEAARRLKAANPQILATTPRKVIHAYHDLYAGVAAFHIRRRQIAA